MKMSFRSVFAGIIGCLACLLVFSGCSDSPETKAARQARKETEAAVKMVQQYSVGEGVDYEAAKEKVKSAFTYANKAGSGVDSVYLVGGDLAKAHAMKLSDGIADYQNGVVSALDSIGSAMLELASLEAEYEMHEMLWEVSGKELSELKDILNGSGEPGTVMAKLNEQREKLEKLQSQLAEYEAKAESAKSQSDRIQAQADEMLKKAQLLKGEARIALERKAYNLIRGVDASGKKVLGKIDYDKKLQAALDMVEVISDKIGIVEPLVSKLEDDLQSIKARIGELSDEDMRNKHLKDMASIEGQIAGKVEQVRELIGKLDAADKDYNDYFSSLIATYDEATQAFKKIRGREFKNLARVELAEVCDKQASLYADRAEYIERLCGYAAKYVELASEEFAEDFVSLKDEYSAAYEQAVTSAKEKFDSCLESYESVVNASRDEVADRAVRSYMMAIYDRIKFEEATANDAQVIEELLTKIDEYKEIAIKSDPYFSRTLVAKMYQQYGIEFKTEEEKLLEKYNALRVDFMACENLAGTDRTDNLISLLEELSTLEKPRDMKVYDDLLKYALESYKEDWLAIAKLPNPPASLELFGDQLESDEESAEGEFTDSEPTDMFGEDANSF